MGCKIFLVRHGETLWNHARRYQGHADIPLSASGVAQARALAGRLASQSFAGFYASDLQRAYATALILAAPHGLAVQKVPALREIDFGDWEGLTREEIIELYPDLSRRWWSQPRDTRLPGGETLTEVATRAVGALREIAARHPDDQVVVVTHGGTIRAGIASLIHMDLNQYWRLRQDNTALSIIEFFAPDRAQLLLFNDTCHLEGSDSHNIPING